MPLLRRTAGKLPADALGHRCRDAEPKVSVSIAVCPDAATFSRYYYGEKNPALAEHLKSCPACREDLAFFARSQQPRERTLPVNRRLVWLAVAAAAVVFTLIPWPWMKKPKNRPTSSSSPRSTQAWRRFRPSTVTS